MHLLRSALFGALLAATCAFGATPTFRSLYKFAGENGDGIGPIGPLTVGAGGIIYGTTTAGGALGKGTVFALAPPTAGGHWTETILWSLGGAGDGGNPWGGVVIGSGGVLYGTTAIGGAIPAPNGLGGGVVFSLTPPSSPGGAWSEAVLWNFGGVGDGIFAGSLAGPR